MVSLARFFGRTASEGAAFALGVAVGPALAPAVRELQNETWARYQSRPLGAGDAAAIVAEDVALEDWGVAEAAKTGIDGDRFDKLVRAARDAVDLQTAFELWRRDVIDDGDFEHALRKARLEPRWLAPLKTLKQRLLAPADLANARQQGYIDQPRQYEESAKQGVDNERAELLFLLSGLPPGVETGLEMLRRNIINEGEFAQLVREGHTKTKYTDELLAMRRRLLGGATLVALHLKGWIEAPEFHERMAALGYSAADADDWYRSAGRPAAPVQMFTAWARGVDGPDGQPMDQAQFLKGIRESDIRPEWGPMLWGIRHAYPSLFQLRRAVQDGGISRARALTILRYERYEDGDAKALVDSWLAPTSAGAKGLTAAELTAEYEGHYLTAAEYLADLQELGYSAQQAREKARVVDAKRVKTARDSAIARARSEYVRHRINRAQLQAALATEGVPEPAQDLILVEADHERELTADALTAAQVKKAFRSDLFDRQTALDRLQRLGYDPGDDAKYLDA